MNEKKIAIFDVCGTLYYSNTSFDFLRYYFEERGNKKYLLYQKFISLFPVKAMNYLLFRYLKTDLIRKFAVEFLKDEGISDLKASARSFYENYLRKREISETIQLIEELKETHDVILLSASFDFIVEYIASQFGIDYIASSLAYSNDLCLGRYSRDLLYFKKEAFLEIYNNYNSLVVVTDNPTDLALIRMADHAIVLSKQNNIPFWNNNLRGKYRLILK